MDTEAGDADRWHENQQDDDCRQGDEQNGHAKLHELSWSKRFRYRYGSTVPSPGTIPRPMPWLIGVCSWECAGPNKLDARFLLHLGRASLCTFLKGSDAHWHRQMVQPHERLWLHYPGWRRTGRLRSLQRRPSRGIAPPAAGPKSGL